MALAPRHTASFLDPFGLLPDLLHSPAWAAHTRIMEESAIPVEETMEEGTLVVRAELPGVDPERDIDIGIRGQTLVIRAQRRQRSNVEEGGVRRSEIRYGSFSRSVPLPPGCGEGDINATYRDGVLEVRLPVAQYGGETRKVEVQRA